MLFSSKVSLVNLVTLCQAFRVGHGAGLSLTDVFLQQARKGPFATRDLLGRIGERLKEGDALEDVLKTEGKSFPSLFNSMIAVGEQTGNLPEVFHELERYYRQQLTLRRQFMAEIAWPVFQLIAAIGVITLLILILGFIAKTPEEAFDPLGFGVGMAGAIKFLVLVGIFFTGLFVMYFLTTRVLGQKSAVHRFLLNVPAIGPCMQALALSRLSLAMKLTMDSSLPTPKAMRKSLLASGNGAYEACAEPTAERIKDGADIHEALAACQVFPEEFLSSVHTGEESGELPELMGRMSERYQEEASHKLKILNRFASFGVWAFVAILLIWAIFRIAFSVLGEYDKALKGI